MSLFDQMLAALQMLHAECAARNAHPSHAERRAAEVIALADKIGATDPVVAVTAELLDVLKEARTLRLASKLRASLSTGVSLAGEITEWITRADAAIESAEVLVNPTPEIREL